MTAFTDALSGLQITGPELDEGEIIADAIINEPGKQEARRSNDGPLLSETDSSKFYPEHSEASRWGVMMQLWTSGDIAKVLEVSGSTVSNWAYYGRDYIPTPAATTQAGARLWTEAQAKQIIAGYYQRKETKEQRKAATERALRMITHLREAS